MASVPKKQYGLILKKEDAPLSSRVKVAAAFAVDDADDDVVETQVMSSENASASTMRIRMQAKRMYEKAVAEDPSVFQYDEIYDDIQAVRDAKQSEQKMADKERKPKYIESLLKAHKRRQVEHQLRDERKQEKERKAEGELYKDKEVFVTGAYRKQMEEAQELGKELLIQDRLDELTAVEKQKFWQAGFHRTVLHDIARDVEPVPSTSKGTSITIKSEPTDNDNSCSPDFGEKLKELRRKINSSEDEPLGSFERQKVKVEPNKVEEANDDERILKNSIYSDESEDDIPKEEVKVELKPGLNILSKTKKLTKAEQLRSRFTPSDSGSEEEDFEDAEKRRHRRTHETRGDAEVNVDIQSDKSSQRRNRSRGEEAKRRVSDDRSHGRRERSRGRKRHEGYERRSRSRSVENYSKKHDRRRSRSRTRNEKRQKKENEQSSRNSKGREGAKGDKRTGLISEPKSKEERLREIKKILKQRNGPEEIAEFRKRYLERKESGFVTLPL